ncbi:MAG: DUF3365 domain-containing protein [Planctomycetes bacterium]|nr:DUF3365 domain-containing protein [Planctomycetota bacterium]
MSTGAGCWLAAALLLSACSDHGAWVPSAADAPAQASRRAAAAAARDQLASQLLGELTAALADGGPAKAIAVCRERAPALAAQVGSERHLRIGRTSQRLRNPANRAPAWATAAIASAAAEPTFFTGPDQQLGALYAIRLLPQCVQCHGRTEDLSAEVRSALRRHYPDDAATGFAVGDLRGWFWVEVP